MISNIKRTVINILNFNENTKESLCISVVVKKIIYFKINGNVNVLLVSLQVISTLKMKRQLEQKRFGIDLQLMNKILDEMVKQDGPY